MEQALTVNELLANARDLDGSRVLVVGFFMYYLENVAIYASATRDRTPEAAVWLVHPATVHGDKATRALTRKWVRVAGTFHNQCLARGGYPAEISGITTLELAEPVG